jgi:hypothetical protein
LWFSEKNAVKSQQPVVDTPYRTTTQTKKNGVKNGKKRSKGIG